ncbi:MAG: ATP phosphoribosyltransferase [Mycoplasmataceae bacterium]|jgi:ATP phosphoribosyltransferase|nr:ATP phosphoribosyltransferase [Mycoplasmataceae bacterium]
MKIAIQKKGRLNDVSSNFLKTQQINLPSEIKRDLVINSGNNQIFLLRDDDIPNIVNSNIADCGIVGNDVLTEYQLTKKKTNIQIVEQFAQSACRLSIASPFKNLSLSDLKNKTIATSFPNIVKNWLKSNKIKAKVVVLSGSVELAVNIGYADVICDLVSSGQTLKENGLFENIKIKDVYPVLIKNKNFKEELCK